MIVRIIVPQTKFDIAKECDFVIYVKHLLEEIDKIMPFA